MTFILLSENKTVATSSCWTAGVLMGNMDADPAFGAAAFRR